MLERLLTEIRACRICVDHLPLGPRPVVVARPSARILIVGQAPGTKVHATGIPWNDRSGDTLRGWMAVDRAVFYDPNRIAILPMGFCYPGVMPSKNGTSGGDAPPRPECAPEWHERVWHICRRLIWSCWPGCTPRPAISATAERRP